MSTRPGPSDDEIRSWGARCTLEQAAWALSMGHNQARAAVKRGDFPVPTFRVGRQTVVPTAPIRALLMIDQPPNSTEAEAIATSASALTDETPYPKGSLNGNSRPNYVAP